MNTMKYVGREPSTKLCIVTGYTLTPEWMEIAGVTVRTMAEYCDRWGHGFRVYTEGFDESRHPAWSKVLFVKDTLPHYEWVFWIDADAAITNQLVNTDRFTKSDADILVTKDVDTCVLNTGVFFIRRCDFSFWLLDEMWSREKWANKELWEQSALVDIYLEGKTGNRLMQYDMREFNGFCDWISSARKRGTVEDLQWHAGDFIAHASCLSQKKRLDALCDAVSLAVR